MMRSTFSTLALVCAVAPATMAANLTWSGSDPTNPTFWDQITSNWTGDFTTYLDGDDVRFDDSASTFDVAIQASVSPASITFDSASGSTYTVTGAGLIGQASLDLTGDVTAVLNNNVTNAIGNVSIAPGATLVHELTGGETQFFGALSGSGDLVVEGNQLVLTGDNSAFTGTMTVNGGTLNSNNANALAGAVVVNAGGSILTFNDTYVSSTPITLNGGTLIGGGTTAVTFNGNTTLTADSQITGVGLTLSSVAAGSHVLTVSANQDATINIGSLSGSQSLVKTGGGTLALTGTNAFTGGYTLNAGDLDVTGLSGGGVTIASGQTLAGSGGALTGNATIQSGGTVAVGDGPLVGVNQTSLSVTYVDADVTSNTTLADGTAMVEGVHYLVDAPAADGLWDVRSFATNGTIISSNNGGGEDAPALQTTISGLTPGEEVEVFAYLWNATSVSWRLRADLVGPDDDGTADGQVDQGWNAQHFDGSAFGTTAFVTENVGGSGLNPGPLSTSTGGDPAFEDGGLFTNGAGVVMTEEGDRSMYQASLGVATADANGEIVVFIDDLVNGGANSRTWFDGVGYGTTTVLPTFEDNINVLTVDGDLSFDAGSVLEIEIFADNVLDRLDVTGQLTAGGTLDVNLAAGAPALQAGDSFDILDFSSVSGSFLLDLPTLDGGLSWNTSNLFTTGVITVGGGVVGDTDGDGDVDDFDLLNAISNFTGSLAAGTGGKGIPEGDTDTDADVDDFDLLNMISGFTGSLASPSVPEPASLALLGLGGLLFARRRRG